MFLGKLRLHGAARRLRGGGVFLMGEPPLSCGATRLRGGGGGRLGGASGVLGSSRCARGFPIEGRGKLSLERAK